MKKLTVIGNILGATGYSSHTRQLVNALYKINPEISLESPKFQGWETQVTDDELKMLKQEPYIGESVLAIMIPHQWKSILSEGYKNFYGYCVWEGSEVPKFWIDIFADQRVTKILCPSMHTIEAINNTLKNEKDVEFVKLMMKKIVSCPHGVDHELFKPREKVDDGVFRYICNGGWAQGMNDRKGLQFAIQAFNAEFSKDEPVEMMIKLNTSYCPQGWNLVNEISKLNLRDNGGRLNIMTDTIPFEKIPELYALGNVFVAPNMSESFGLPLAEAMACGLPCITTNYGGQTDFVNNNNGWLIDYELIENDWDNMYEGISWGKPNLEHLQKLMRHIYNNPEEVKKKSKQAVKDIKKYSWERTAKIILNL